MSEKRKISLRKILQSIVTLIVLVGCVLAITSATKQQRKRVLKGISVDVQNSEYGFIDEGEVKELLLTNKNIELSKTQLQGLNIRSMEKVVDANPWIDHAEVYVDNDKVLHVEVQQRVPLVRVFDKKGDSYYLDSSLKMIPLSDRYVHNTMVVTNVPELKDDSVGIAVKAQILKLTDFIGRDSFWREQVSQVVMNDDGTFELVPVLGKHRILIGTATKLDKKFGHLFKFYKNVLNRIGWDKYEVLDVRYKGQLVASPSIPWNVPQDRVRNRINWVTSITGEPAPPMAVRAKAPPVVHRPAAKPEVKASGNDGVSNDEGQADAQAYPKRGDASVADENSGADKAQDQTTDKKKKEKKIPKYIYQGSDQ